MVPPPWDHQMTWWISQRLSGTVQLGKAHVEYVSARALLRAVLVKREALPTSRTSPSGSVTNLV